MTISRIRKQSTHELVLREIGRRIVSGELPPGKALPSEVNLVKTLGVSRTALREALRVLGAKGLVQAKQKSGTVVCPREAWNFFDPDVFAWRLNSNELEQVVAELHQLRHLIEPVAASFAASHANASDLKVIKAAYEDMEATANQGLAMVDPDVRFHRGIIAASGNSLLSSLGQVIAVALRAYFEIGISGHDGQESSLTLHKAVLDAIVARNAAGARLAMQKVIEDSEKDARQLGAWRKSLGHGPRARAAHPSKRT